MKGILIWLLFASIVSGARAQLFFDVAPFQGIQHSVDTDLLFGGNGVGFFDFDEDGWDDLTFVQEGDSILFYKNNNGNFDPDPSFIFGPVQTRQVIWVDYDNDDDYDLFRTATNGQLRLFQNDGNFNFTDVSVAAGLSPFNTNDFGVTFADYDRDGYLDFYLARYFLSGNPLDPTNTNALYRNNGDGTFTNVTISAGVGNGVQPTFLGIWTDINDDLYPDLYVINDRLLWGNSLYLNNGDGTFTDITGPSGTAMFGEDPMGATFEDYDNDHDIDILCSNGGPPTKPIRLYSNVGGNVFQEVAGPAGIFIPVTNHCTWGATWFDADNDSHKDLYIATGLLTLDASNEMRSYLFMNDGNAHFTDTPTAFESPHIAASYAVAKGDMNNDGYADLVVQNAKGFNSFLWRNKSANLNPNNYVKITLEGTISNKMAIGARIHVYCENNEYRHYTRCGENFVSQSSQHFIFGLGDKNKVDSIHVFYPSGVIDKYYDLFANQHYYLTEGETLENTIQYSGSLVFCENDSIVLDGGDHDNHLWSNGDTTRFITVTESGDYSVAVNVFGFNLISNVVSVTVLAPPVINTTISHPLCHDDASGWISLDLNTSALDPEINWSNGASGSFISNLSDGMYTYNYSDEGGCTLSDSFQLIDVGPVILYHSVEFNGNLYDLQLLVTGGVGPYSITIDGTPASFFNPDMAAGTYQIEVVDANGCSYSEAIQVGSLSVMETNGNELAVFPNPSKDGVFEINFAGVLDHIALYDLNGKEIAFEYDNDHRLKIMDPTVGIYLLLVQTDYGSKMMRIVIN
jgi:hypothetical protein